MVTGKKLDRNENLEMVIDVRDEIVHHVQRAIVGKGNVPHWFARLYEMGLFVGSDDSPDYWLLSQKLPSYRLAYWSYQKIERAARKFAQGLGSATDTMVARAAASTVENFRTPDGCAPSEFAAFDKRYGVRIKPRH